MLNTKPCVPLFDITEFRSLGVNSSANNESRDRFLAYSDSKFLLLIHNIKIIFISSNPTMEKE